MDNEVKENTETTKKTHIWVRYQLPINTHNLIKAYNRTQPRERLDDSTVRLIQIGLESVASQH